MVEVSVILPFYQAESTLDDTIHSVVSQTFQDWQLILVDDGSTDEGPRIAKSWVEKDARILYFRQDNKGRSAARNAGMDLSQGKWISFLDADDCLLEDGLASLYCFADLGYDAIFGHDQDLTEQNYYTADYLAYELLPALFDREAFIVTNRKQFPKEFPINAVWGKLYSRTIIEKYNLRFEDGIKFAEDVLFNLDVLSVASRLCIVNKTVVMYNRDNLGTMRTFVLADIDSVHKTVRVLESKYKELALDQVINKEYFDSCVSKMVMKLYYRMVYYANDVSKPVKVFSELMQDQMIRDSLSEYRVETKNEKRFFSIFYSLIAKGHTKIALLGGFVVLRGAYSVQKGLIKQN